VTNELKEEIMAIISSSKYTANGYSVWWDFEYSTAKKAAGQTTVTWSLTSKHTSGGYPHKDGNNWAKWYATKGTIKIINGTTTIATYNLSNFGESGNKVSYANKV
jgi:hypothetical protein